MNDQLNELFELIMSGKDINYSKDGITLKKKGNEVYLKIEDSQIEKEIFQFQEYLDELDDDLFIEINEHLNVKLLQEMINSEDIDKVRAAIFKFKSVAKQVIKEKIKYLTECLNK